MAEREQLSVGELTVAKILPTTGTQASHIADAGAALKTDYAQGDIDDAGTIDGTELAVVLNLVTAAYNDLATKFNTLLTVVENVGLNASS